MLRIEFPIAMRRYLFWT